MKQQIVLLNVVATAVCFWPLLAAADESQSTALAADYEQAVQESPELRYNYEVEAGAGYVSQDSFKFGEYNGHEDSGPFAIGSFTFRGRDRFDSENTKHWEATGQNLGLDSRSIHLEYGHQGRFGFFFDYDQIPHNQIGDAESPFSGVGSSVLTLPPALKQSANNSQSMTALNPSLRTVEIETDRQNLSSGFNLHFDEAWQVKGHYAHEFKEGTDTIAGIFGFNGGNPGGIMLPKPIDYETDKVDASLSYTGQRAQLELGYFGSWFRDNNNALRWDNPYSAQPSGSAWEGDPSQGQLALPPDNQAHQVMLSGGYSLGETTRLTGTFSYGVALQDEKFLPYTINTGLVVNTPLPRDSLDGEVETTLVDVSASTRPLPKTDLRARYRYYNRDNNTPQATYLVVPGDSEDQGTISDSTARINLPYSTEKHTVNIDAGYRVLPSTKVTVGYDFEATERTFSEVDTSLDHTGRVKVQSSPFEMVNGQIEYAHTIRDSFTYDDNAPFVASHTAEYLATTDPNNGYNRGFENHPDLRKFYLADRQTDDISASVSVMPMEQVTVGLSGGYVQDDYYNSELGLTDSNNSNVTLDVSYSPRPDVTGYVFVTHERFNYEEKGRQFRPTTSFNDLINDPTIAWRVNTKDRINTVGGRVEWKALPGLNLGVEYTFSKADTEFDLSGGSAITILPLPDIESTLHSIGISANYQVMDNMAMNLGYRFEQLDTNDFALDDVDPDTIGQFITLGEDSPDYVEHLVGVSFSYKF